MQFLADSATLFQVYEFNYDIKVKAGCLIIPKSHSYSNSFIRFSRKTTLTILLTDASRKEGKDDDMLCI